ncbi:hypothetical protein DFH09DRAFT_1144976, partial [Mycena vulgaris]
MLANSGIILNQRQSCLSISALIRLTPAVAPPPRLRRPLPFLRCARARPPRAGAPQPHAPCPAAAAAAADACVLFSSGFVLSQHLRGAVRLVYILPCPPFSLRLLNLRVPHKTRRHPQKKMKMPQTTPSLTTASLCSSARAPSKPANTHRILLVVLWVCAPRLAASHASRCGFCFVALSAGKGQWATASTSDYV